MILEHRVQFKFLPAKDIKYLVNCKKSLITSNCVGKVRTMDTSKQESSGYSSQGHCSGFFLYALDCGRKLEQPEKPKPRCAVGLTKNIKQKNICVNASLSVVQNDSCFSLNKLNPLMFIPKMKQWQSRQLVNKY